MQYSKLRFKLARTTALNVNKILCKKDVSTICYLENYNNYFVKLYFVGQSISLLVDIFLLYYMFGIQNPLNQIVQPYYRFNFLS